MYVPMVNRILYTLWRTEYVVPAMVAKCYEVMAMRRRERERGLESVCACVCLWCGRGREFADVRK